MVEIGAYSRIYYLKYAKYPKQRDSQFKVQSNELSPLKLVHIIWALYWLLMGLTLSLLAFTVEATWQKWNAKTKVIVLKKI